MKIVTDGEKFALKKWSLLGWLYFDTVSHGFWWGKNSEYFSHCWTADKVSLERHMRRLKA